MQMRWACTSPARRQWYPHKGLVGPQLSVQLHKVLLLPLHHPRELAVLHLNLEHGGQRLHADNRQELMRYFWGGRGGGGILRDFMRMK